MPARAQRGAAILLAMLTVTLVATFAGAALWQQWRNTEVEAAERGRLQSAWVLTGALDWARLILREDARSGGTDHLAEPWAVPLQEARLSTFLAASTTGASDAGTDTENVFLSGRIVDQQSLLNVNNLLESGRVSETGLRSFQRLFDLLGLPPAELEALTEGLRRASDLGAGNQPGTPAPLMPQRLDQLGWLGVSASTQAALAPYITLLPGSRIPVNLNTAAPEVIYAAVNNISMAEAQQLAARRDQAHFTNVAQAREVLPQHAQALTEGTVSVATRYFEVRGRIRMDQLIVQERSLVQRDGLDVRTLQRERSTPPTSGMASAAPLR